jgi:hypothetical protein
MEWIDMTEPRTWPSWRQNLRPATINGRPAWQVVAERKRRDHAAIAQARGEGVNNG